VSDNLTPTAQAILDHLHDQPPATIADLRERTGRSRSAIDKALAELTKTGLITKTPSDTGDGPTRWALTDPGPADAAPAEAVEAVEPPEPPDTDPDGTGHTPDHDDPTSQDTTDGTDPSDNQATPADGTTAAGDAAPPDQVADETTDPAEEVRVCRGCGQQMPRVCPTCRAKTTAYCGICRQTHPTRRRAPGEPQILANGLPKLLPGQLAHLVLDILRSQPLPDHLGVTGWTPGRVAIFLPGRSTGAIANALDKLTTTGQAQLLGEDPKRYQPTPTDNPDLDQPDTTGNPDEQP
jgi:hypothetical protein